MTAANMCGVCFLKAQEASVAARGPRQRLTNTTHHMVSGKIDPIAYKPIGKKSKECPPPSIHTGKFYFESTCSMFRQTADAPYKFKRQIMNPPLVPPPPPLYTRQRRWFGDDKCGLDG